MSSTLIITESFMNTWTKQSFRIQTGKNFDCPGTLQSAFHIKGNVKERVKVHKRTYQEMMKASHFFHNTVSFIFLQTQHIQFTSCAWKGKKKDGEEIKKLYFSIISFLT